jgi:hypothetical protein
MGEMKLRPQRNNDFVDLDHRNSLKTSKPFHNLPKLKQLSKRLKGNEK